MLDENMSLLEIAKDLTGDTNVQIIEENIMPIYECDCSKEKIEKGLITIGKKELQDIINTQINIETVCHFCNEKYTFTKEELEKLGQTIDYENSYGYSDSDSDYPMLQLVKHRYRIDKKTSEIKPFIYQKR